ncbi:MULTISPECIES: helix-turn-helix domain-containing protein [Cellulophaga]|uniref:helix-turn-helix domain-containing protein n=1 Tax=Cellulophaga TaxID=104264 RepID=UPI0020905B97|nr:MULTISPECIES: helix-turn-helix domain-containing protein [Cellulophaga]MDO6769344.1 helix-turn-helix domain-containing protein [Cellulophaga sp. 1_MG-2023]
MLRFIDNIEWGFIFPVFIFLFTVHQVNHPIRHSKKTRWLFVPFIYYAFINIFSDLDTIAGVYDIPNSVYRVIGILRLIGIFIVPPFIIGILIYTYSFIKFSNNTQEKKWITILWTLVSVLLLSWVLAIILGLFFEYDVSSFMKLLALFGTFVIHWTAYFGLFKYRLAKDKEGINKLLTHKISFSDNDLSIDTNLKKVNYSNNLEPPTTENLYYIKLEALCKNHQIYRDSTLNREKVAEKLGISSGYVSKLVNTITGKNFANYINYYRVEAVKEMILDSEFKNYSLLAIGLESGFTSKTTFYNAFKKATGMTPNAYRKAHK